MSYRTTFELQRENDDLRKAMTVLRNQNIKLAVENNNLRSMIGQPLLSVKQDYLTRWEQSQEVQA